MGRSSFPRQHHRICGRPLPCPVQQRPQPPPLPRRTNQFQPVQPPQPIQPLAPERSISGMLKGEEETASSPMSNDKPSNDNPSNDKQPQQPFTVDVSARISRLPPYLFGRINKMKY